MKAKKRVEQLLEEYDEVSQEEDIYSWDQRDSMVEDDVLTAEEAAFMEGYEEAG